MQILYKIFHHEQCIVVSCLCKIEWLTKHEYTNYHLFSYIWNKSWMKKTCEWSLGAVFFQWHYFVVLDIKLIFKSMVSIFRRIHTQPVKDNKIMGLFFRARLDIGLVFTPGQASTTIEDCFIVPAERVREGTMKWAPYICGCVVNKPCTAVDWPLLLHTLTNHD